MRKGVEYKFRYNLHWSKEIMFIDGWNIIDYGMTLNAI